MPLTAQARRLLDRIAEAGAPPFGRMSVLEARAVVEASRSLQGEPEAVGAVHDVIAAGALPVRVYHPTRGQPRPLLIHLHGGGFVTGSVAVADTPCRALANTTGYVVASVGSHRANAEATA
jgi:acetyl esterase